MLQRNWLELNFSKNRCLWQEWRRWLKTAERPVTRWFLRLGFVSLRSQIGRVTFIPQLSSRLAGGFWTFQLLFEFLSCLSFFHYNFQSYAASLFIQCLWNSKAPNSVTAFSFPITSFTVAACVLPSLLLTLSIIFLSPVSTLLKQGSAKIKTTSDGEFHTI